MNENNVIPDLGNDSEPVKTPVYCSEFLLSKDLYYDFCSVSYYKTKKVFLTFFLLVASTIVISLLVGNYDIVFGYGPFISLLMVLVYFKTKKSIRIGYERMMISEGKERIVKYELFEDKIVAFFDGAKREYFYHQITKLFETNNFILLHLQHNLYIIINKDRLDASIDDVKAFLLERCNLVKNRKFIVCSSDKKLTLIFMISLIAVSVMGTAVSVILTTSGIV